jgi:hypothetical protein
LHIERTEPPPTGLLDEETWDMLVVTLPSDINGVAIVKYNTNDRIGTYTIELVNWTTRENTTAGDLPFDRAICGAMGMKSKPTTSALRNQGSAFVCKVDLFAGSDVRQAPTGGGDISARSEYKIRFDEARLRHLAPRNTLQHAKRGTLGKCSWTGRPDPVRIKSVVNADLTRLYEQISYVVDLSATETVSTTGEAGFLFPMDSVIAVYRGLSAGASVKIEAVSTWAYQPSASGGDLSSEVAKHHAPPMEPLLTWVHEFEEHHSMVGEYDENSFGSFMKKAAGFLHRATGGVVRFMPGPVGTIARAVHGITGLVGSN